MAAHRKSRPRPAGGATARAAAAVALAGAATATGLGGAAHAEPQPAPGRVKAEVDKLYREAEVATEKYNGAREKARSAGQRLHALQDEAARRQERLNTARQALGSVAAAQYRGGGLDPSLQLLLSSDPDGYLDRAAFAERAGSRQSAAVGRARAQLREIERLRGAARVELASLASRQAELKRHRKTITGKLDAARDLWSRLTPAQRAALTDGTDRAARSSTGDRNGPAAPGSAPPRAPGPRAARAVSYAHQKIGSPYVWGASGPNAFDCSGLVQAAYRSAGISLPRTTYAQIAAGRRVSRSELLPGDLVFFYSGISHVGIYVGDGRMIHAPNPSAPVRLAPIDEMPFAGATRVT
ncbi:C40 family peptidase [Streptomyces sp. Tu 3180]|uniref:C40 family peptidase n=1 Tax=Streptomyces sp. Tu 3180 TaxID=2682611 RepID=UPI00135B25FC|nr:C40 family peptidase [Streptomyces sp. Tu 3180]KAF3467076.1 NlpC/P60 family protein [Streptomyces sp. Tu 3180]